MKGASDMAFDMSLDYANGTCLQGRIDITRARIEEVFGAPLYDSTDNDEKVMTEWGIMFDDGTCATIYDWKRYEMGAVGFHEVYDWHIGGTSHDAMDKVTAVLLKRGGERDDWSYINNS